MDANGFLAWASPIAAGLLTLAGQLWLNQRFSWSDEKRKQEKAATEAKRRAEKEWQELVIKRLDKQVERLDEQDRRLDTVLSLQCSQTRSDILHKCHRYLDDIGKASTEEKEALKAEHVDYADICKANGIENEFIDLLVQRVMELPERDV